ncbi:MAG: hypothetical protein Fur0041_12050 [Bacteroidia bacterium]
MKLFFKAFTVAILSVITLISGSGFALGKMICLESGHTVVAFHAVEDCCGDEEQTGYAFESKCCDITNISFEGKTFTGSYQHEISQLIAFPAIVPFCFHLSDVSDLTDSSSFLRISEKLRPSSPPLEFLSIYRI